MPTRTKSRFFRVFHIALVLGLIAFALGSAGCSTTGADGVKSSSLVMSFTVADRTGHATALARSDLNTTVVFGAGSVSGEVFQKPTANMAGGFPIYGPITAAAGKVYVFDRHRDVKLTLNVGQPLPAFCAVLFRVGEAEALGITFEAANLPTHPTP
jgi:hypothetical protein